MREGGKKIEGGREGRIRRGREEEGEDEEGRRRKKRE